VLALDLGTGEVVPPISSLLGCRPKWDVSVG